MDKASAGQQNFLLFSIYGRILIFFNILSWLLFFLYILGNFQIFLDSTQVFLLRNLQYTVLISGILAGYYIAILIIMTIKNKKTYIFRFILTALSIFFNFTLFIGLKFMLSWFQF